MKIKSSDLASEIMKTLKNYSEDTIDTTKSVILRKSKDAVKKLKDASPQLTGEYAKHWKSTVQYEDSKEIRVSVHVSKPEYSLTHLLEKGHAKRNGGRVGSKIHIKPIEQEVIEEIQSELREIL